MTGFVQAMILLTVFCPGLAGVLAAEDASPFESAQSSPLSPAGTQTSPLRTTPLTSVLPAEQAFRLNVVVELPDTIVAIWEITDGYYLYRKSLQLEEAGSAGLLGEIRIPAGTLINDQFFGDVEVFHDRVTVSVPLAS
ncbi:MAG: protein-disulfide reductase DsbD N-terminal domain-containing protein, partial [Pseudohongiellaceae bacterium]